MIGILLITHGCFGESLIQNVSNILNRRPPLLAQLGVAWQDDPLDTLPLARLRLQEVNGGDGVMLMTDIFGATPANLVLKLLEPGRIEGVSGLSLPMLLRALTYRDKGMETMLQKAVSGAHDGVIKLPTH